MSTALGRENIVFVQLLGLCPLLAVSNTTVTAVGLALATLFVIVTTNTLVSALRSLLAPHTRLPAMVVVIAATVTGLELVLRAYLPLLHQSLGIFLPLIVTNCMILARAEAFASRNEPLRAALDGLQTGVGFGLVLIALGLTRELLGTGALLANLSLLIPQSNFSGWTVADRGLLLFSLPAGAFIACGLLLALHNWQLTRSQRITTKEPLVSNES